MLIAFIIKIKVLSKEIRNLHISKSRRRIKTPNKQFARRKQYSFSLRFYRIIIYRHVRPCAIRKIHELTMPNSVDCKNTFTRQRCPIKLSGECQRSVCNRSSETSPIPRHAPDSWSSHRRKTGRIYREQPPALIPVVTTADNGAANVMRRNPVSAKAHGGDGGVATRAVHYWRQ